MSIRVPATERNVITHQGIKEERPKSHIKVMGSWVPLKVRDIISGRDQTNALTHLLRGRKHEGAPPPLSQRNVIVVADREEGINVKPKRGKGMVVPKISAACRDVLSSHGVQKSDNPHWRGKKTFELSPRDAILHHGVNEGDNIRLLGKRTVGISSPSRNPIEGVDEKPSLKGKRTYPAERYLAAAQKRDDLLPKRPMTARNVITAEGLGERDSPRFLGIKTFSPSCKPPHAPSSFSGEKHFPRHGGLHYTLGGTPR